MLIPQRRLLWLIMNWKLLYLARWESLCWGSGKSVRKCKLSPCVMVLLGSWLGTVFVGRWAGENDDSCNELA